MKVTVGLVDRDTFLNLLNNFWYEYVGASLHFDKNVRLYLGQDNFVDELEEEVPWSSFHYKLLDYFHWRYLKCVTYETLVRNELDLFAEMRASCKHIEAIPGIFRRVHDSMS